MDRIVATNAHLVQENTTILFQDSDCYLIEPENDCDFSSGCNNEYCKRGCHTSDIDLNTRPKAPLCKTRIMTTKNVQGYCNERFEMYRIVNSCNGLLCMDGPYLNDPVVVCKPIMGEFMCLSNPDNKYSTVRTFGVCGLGFSPKNSQYKVIRTFKIWDPISRCDLVEADIYTLGIGSWKSVGSVPFSAFNLEFPTYLNGSLHWLFVKGYESTCIISFDWNKEQFDFHDAPTCRKNLSMGVLGGSLYVCESKTSDDVHIGIWVMEKYGDWDSWTKLFTIKYGYCKGPRYGFFLPISYLSNGTLLLIHYPSDELIIYYHQTGSNVVNFKRFKVCFPEFKLQAIVHNPSFISLKDILMGATTNLRC
ncbi:F-box associated domain [Trema orientale]|uniref:F-box associated domain n=1 Tax=Trema orientale TaxID=63057 RepID=A0A2P5CAB5_TREOI|nr:F-box associated domain [Trema orientale]